MNNRREPDENRYVEERQRYTDTGVSAGRAKNNFLTDMSHKIRSPINAVLGMNEMIIIKSEENKSSDTP